MVKGSIKVLLIDDQPIVAKAIELMVGKDQNIEFQYCQNPLEAMEWIKRFKPTVILQDLVMPELDGLTLVKYLKSDPWIGEIPLVVLSSKEEPKVKAEAFTLGANDYLVKLPDHVELLARIHYHSQSYCRLLERNEVFEKLRISEEALRGELNEAAAYVRELLPKKIAKPPILADWHFTPSESLGGDAFGYEWLDADHFSFYLLDVCGHGVGAALLSISILNAISSKALREATPYSPSSVLSALNKAYLMEKHHQLFFTLWYGVIQLSTRKLTYSTGGHPPVLLMKANGEIETLSTRGIAVGAIEESTYQEEEVTLPPSISLFLFSDGAYEMPKKGGGMLSYQDIVELIVKEKGDMPRLLKELEKKQEGLPPLDDVSILKLAIP